MINLNNLKRLALLSLFSLNLTPVAAIADDIDIFTGASGGDAAAPNVMFLLDTTADFDSNATNPLAGTAGYNTSATQGGVELNSIINEINALSAKSTLVDIGVSAFNGTSAGVWYGARDITNSSNLNVLKYLLANYSVHTGAWKRSQAERTESGALYELYLYFNSQTPYGGTPGTSGNDLVDYSTNTNTGSTVRPSSSGTPAGLTDNFAVVSGKYVSPSTACSKNYVIYIVNNSNNDNPKFDALSYGGYPSPALTYIPANAGGDKRDLMTWADYLYKQGITLYVIDVQNGHSSSSYTNNLQQAAKLGGGKWFKVDATTSTSVTDLSSTLSQIFTEIQAVNSTFASTSLPVSTTNRAQEKNQVFIPMFRPDSQAYPRWMGNMKQYQLITVGGSVELGDSSSPSQQAINNNTGFPTDCAVSFWTTTTTTDTTSLYYDYWNHITETPSPKGACAVATQWSDSPDGPVVEKGGTAEVIRKGNNPPTTNTTPTWAVNRTIYTQPLAGGTLTAFNTTSSGLSSTVVNYTQGQDVNLEYNGRTDTSLTRPSLHGDTIHSRPLPIDYGSKVVVYYGSNDGMYRAVDSSNGKELWAFVAPEHYSKLQRLSSNSPKVKYPNSIDTTTTPKDYFFDGSTGIYQNSDNSKIWIYPSMRRGGRMIYAFDVTNNTTPVFKWKAGCPNLTDDTGCKTGIATDSSMSGIGQTWSTPQVAEHISGYDHPVVIIGGGYDSGSVAAANASARNCEDTNSVTLTGCSSPEKGAAFYVFDADTGALVKSFTTDRSVAGDIALIAITTPNVVDHAYVADTGGNIYRIDFKSSGTTDWVMTKIAYTNGGGRKFFFPPALLSVGTSTVYLALGSGDREHPLYSQYPYANVTNRFYVYKDNPQLIPASAYNLDSTDTMFDNTTDGGCSSSSVASSDKKGWFMNLNQYGQGEQTVTSALIASGLVAFSTNRPIAPAVGSCTTTLGEARGYWVNLFNGSGAVNVAGSCGGDRSAIFVGGGLPPSPIFGVVPVDGVATPVVIGAVQKDGGTNSSIAPQKVTPITSPERKLIYWKSSGQN
ncbi:pilus assembly protein [Tolumonas lignilytica]|uniref:pilus assembly protein n=1 Tax=Tolumonas lignilytica TaxID=1283284 RepID=UPI000467AC23|nr:PilC/PilY family type IV pilus protein [Tolumonas lignilytica]